MHLRHPAAGWSQVHKPGVYHSLRPALRLCSSRLMEQQNSVVIEDVGPPPIGMKAGRAVAHGKQWQAEAEAPEPIISALMKLFPVQYASPTSAKRACRRKEIFVAGVPVDTTARVEPGQWVQVVLNNGSPAPNPGGPPKPAGGNQGEEAPKLQVVYEDDHIGIVFKPAGLTTIAPGINCAAARLRDSLAPSAVIGALHKPTPCHRLDLPTCGLLLAAKTKQARYKLQHAFEDRTVEKRYLAIVKGRVGDVGARGTIDVPLKGKPALTEWEVVEETPSATWGTLQTLSLWPKTGRTHQLRRHLAETLATPILGDIRYRSANRLKVKTGTGARKRKLEAPDQGGQQQVKIQEHTGPQEGHEADDGERAVGAAGTAANGGDTTGLTYDAEKAQDGQSQGHQEVCGQQQAVTGAGGDAEMPAAAAADDDLVADMSSDGEGDEEEEEEGGDLAAAEAACESMSGQVVGAGPSNGDPAGRPPGVRAAAGAAGGGKRFDVLANGQVQGLCLCAAELRFTHPATGEPFKVDIPEPDSFKHAKEVEASAAAGAKAGTPASAAAKADASGSVQDASIA